MVNNKKRFAVITIYSFPIGLAATNRILAYSKGIIENEGVVDIFIPFPTDRPNSSNYLDCDNFQGINYCYPNGKYSNKYKIIRAISILSGYREISGLILTIRRILKEHRIHKYKSIIISSDKIFYLLIFSYLAKVLKISSFFIFDEFPTPIRHKLKDNIPKIKQFLYRIALKNINGYISISEKLGLFYNKILPKKTFIMPIILDVSRFSKINKQFLAGEVRYLCYMGNMELAKDNVELIIKSFSLIADQYPDLIFNLYGTPSEKSKIYLINLINSLKLSNRIFIKAKVNSEHVPIILSKAYLLVSSQPETKRASGGFPTKLGEYLASGIPALLTDVGENSKYVKDGVHVFFSKPNDVEAYARKMEFIINNYEEAIRVAQNGELIIKKKYSHTNMGKKMIEFIDSF